MYKGGTNSMDDITVYVLLEFLYNRFSVTFYSLFIWSYVKQYYPPKPNKVRGSTLRNSIYNVFDIFVCLFRV